MHYITRGKIDLDSFGHQVVEDIQGKFAQNWGNQIRIEYKYTYYICPKAVSDKQDGKVRTCHSKPRVHAKTLDEKVWEKIQPIIFDDEKLNEIFEERQSGISQTKQAIQVRLDLVQATLAEREQEFEELAEAYKLAKNKLLRAKLDKDADIVDQQLKDLRKRRNKIKAELAAEDMSRQELQDLHQWLKKVRVYAEKLQNDIDAKIWILDAIELKGTISVVNGKKVGKFECLLGKFSVSCTGEDHGNGG